MPISNPPETKEHKGRVVEGNKVSDKYGVLAAMGQGRGSCSMQTIEINGPKGVDCPGRARESSGLEAVETKRARRGAKRGVEWPGVNL